VSENLNPLVAALESLSEKDLEITVTESEQIFKRGVINYVVERNALVASVRQVALKDVLNYTDRYIASKLDIEDPRDIFFHAAREVTNFVDYAIDGPASNKAPVVEFRDLLPSAHPYSTKTVGPITASARRVRNAAWVSYDPRITDESVRKAVFEAFVQQPRSSKSIYAAARLEALTASVPADIKIQAITAAFGIGNPFAGNNSSAARSARAKLQRRDRKGRFAEMGGGSRIFAMIGDMIKSFVGKFAGNPQDSDRIEVEISGGGADLPSGIYSVPASKVEGLKAILRTGEAPAFKADSKNSRYAIPLQELLANRKSAPTGWTDNGDGTFTSADGYSVSTLPSGEQAPSGSKFIGAGPDGSYDSNKPVLSLSDEFGDFVGYAQEWANLQKLAADNDSGKGKAPKAKARLRKQQPAKGFAQEPGRNKKLSPKDLLENNEGFEQAPGEKEYDYGVFEYGDPKFYNNFESYYDRQKAVRFGDVEALQKNLENKKNAAYESTELKDRAIANAEELVSKAQRISPKDVAEIRAYRGINTGSIEQIQSVLDNPEYAAHHDYASKQLEKAKAYEAGEADSPYWTNKELEDIQKLMDEFGYGLPRGEYLGEEPYISLVKGDDAGDAWAELIVRADGSADLENFYVAKRYAASWDSPADADVRSDGNSIPAGSSLDDLAGLMDEGYENYDNSDDEPDTYDEDRDNRDFYGYDQAPGGENINLDDFAKKYDAVEVTTPEDAAKGIRKWSAYGHEIVYTPWSGQENNPNPSNFEINITEGENAGKRYYSGDTIGVGVLSSEYGYNLRSQNDIEGIFAFPKNKKREKDGLEPLKSDVKKAREAKIEQIKYNRGLKAKVFTSFKDLDAEAMKSLLEDPEYAKYHDVIAAQLKKYDDYENGSSESSFYSDEELAAIKNLAEEYGYSGDVFPDDDGVIFLTLGSEDNYKYAELEIYPGGAAELTQYTAGKYNPGGWDEPPSQDVDTSYESLPLGSSMDDIAGIFGAGESDYDPPEPPEGPEDWERDGFYQAPGNEPEINTVDDLVKAYGKDFKEITSESDKAAGKRVWFYEGDAGSAEITQYSDGTVDVVGGSLVKSPFGGDKEREFSDGYDPKNYGEGEDGKIGALDEAFGNAQAKSNDRDYYDVDGFEGYDQMPGFSQEPGGKSSDPATDAQRGFVANILEKQGDKLPEELRKSMQDILANKEATKGEIGAVIGEMRKAVDTNVPSDRQLASIRRGLISKGLPAKEAADLSKRLPKMTKDEASDLITRLKGMPDTNGWEDASPNLLKKNSEGLMMRYTPKGDGTWDVTPISQDGGELGASSNFKSIGAAEKAANDISLADLPGQDDIEGFAQAPGEDEPLKYKLPVDAFKDANWSAEAFKDRTWVSRDGRIKITYVRDADAGYYADDPAVDTSYLEVSVDGEKYTIDLEDGQPVRYIDRPYSQPIELMDIDDYADEIENVISKHLNSSPKRRNLAKDYSGELDSSFDFRDEWKSKDGKLEIKYVDKSGDYDYETNKGAASAYVEGGDWEVSYDGKPIGYVQNFVLVDDSSRYPDMEPEGVEREAEEIVSDLKELLRGGPNIKYGERTDDIEGFSQSAGQAGGVDEAHIANLSHWFGDPEGGNDATYKSPDGRLTLESMADGEPDMGFGGTNLSRISVSYDGEWVGELPYIGWGYDSADLAKDVGVLVDKFLKKQTGGFDQKPGESSNKRGKFLLYPDSDIFFAATAETEDGGIVRLEKDKGMITPIAYNRNGEIMGQGEPTDNLDKALEDGERLFSELEGNARKSPDEMGGFAQEPGDEPPAWTKDPASSLQYNKLQGILDNQGEKLPTDVRDMVEEAVANKALTKGEMGKLLAEVGKSADLSISYTPKIDRKAADNPDLWDRSGNFTSADGRLKVVVEGDPDGNFLVVTFDGKPVDIVPDYEDEIRQAIEDIDKANLGFGDPLKAKQDAVEAIDRALRDANGESPAAGFAQATGKPEVLQPTSNRGYSTSPTSNKQIEVNPTDDGKWEVSHAYNHMARSGNEFAFDEGSQKFDSIKQALVFANEKLDYYNGDKVFSDAEDAAADLESGGFAQEPGRKYTPINNSKLITSDDGSLSTTFGEPGQIEVNPTNDGKWEVNHQFIHMDKSRGELPFDEGSKTFDTKGEALAFANEKLNYYNSMEVNQDAEDYAADLDYGGFGQAPGNGPSPEVRAKNKALAKRLVEKYAFIEDGGLDEDDEDYEAAQEIKELNENYLDNLARTNPAEYFYKIANAAEAINASPSEFKRMIEKPYNYHDYVLDAEMNTWAEDQNNDHWLNEIGFGSEGEGFAQRPGGEEPAKNYAWTNYPKGRIDFTPKAANKPIRDKVNRAVKEAEDILQGKIDKSDNRDEIRDLQQQKAQFGWAARSKQFKYLPQDGELAGLASDVQNAWDEQDKINKDLFSKSEEDANKILSALGAEDDGYFDSEKLSELAGDYDNEELSDLVQNAMSYNDDYLNGLAESDPYSYYNLIADMAVANGYNGREIKGAIEKPSRYHSEVLAYKLFLEADKESGFGPGEWFDTIGLNNGEDYDFFREDKSGGFAQEPGTGSDLLEEDPNALDLKSVDKVGGVVYKDANGNISDVRYGVYKNEDGTESNRWFAKYANPENRNGLGNTTSKSFNSPEAAEKWLRKQIADGNKKQNKEKTGGLSAKQMEPATPAQYALLQEYADERVPADDLTAQAITEALANKNLTKAQMSALIGPMRDAPFKPGVDPNKPSDRALQSLNSKLVTKDLTPEEVKDILDNLPNMNRAEVDALNDKLRRKKDRPETIGFAQEPGIPGEEQFNRDRAGDDFTESGPAEVAGEMDAYYNSLKGERIDELARRLDAANEDTFLMLDGDNLREMLAESDPDNPDNKKYGKDWAVEQSYMFASDLQDVVSRLRRDNSSDSSLADELDNLRDQVIKRIEDRAGIRAALRDPDDLRNLDLSDVEDEMATAREIYYSTDADKIAEAADDGYWGDYRSGGAEINIDNEPNENGKYEARITYGSDSGDSAYDRQEFDDRDDAIEWAANEAADYNSNLSQNFSEANLEKELSTAIENGTEQEFIDRMARLYEDFGDARVSDEFRYALSDFVDRAQRILDKKNRKKDQGGFAQEPGRKGTPVRDDKLSQNSDGGYTTDPYSDSQIEVWYKGDGEWEVDHSYQYMDKDAEFQYDEGSQTFGSKEEALAFANEKLDYYNSDLVDEDAENSRGYYDDVNDDSDGFSQEPGNAVVSPKMGEPATDAQYDYLKELGGNRDGIDPELATAIQDALSSKNLTKAQMGAMLGQLRALNPKAGVDTGKPTPRQLKRVKDLANSLGLTSAEKRKLGITNLNSKSADEIQRLIDTLKRRGANSPKA
jgi:hypothetical protein